MTTPTFTPTRSPSLKSKKAITYKVKNCGFGDGYVQKAADGIKPKSTNWDLIWNTLLISDADAIEAFMDTLLGYKAFFYTVPGDIQRKYTCDSFSRVQSEGNADTVSMTLVEDFSP